MQRDNCPTCGNISGHGSLDGAVCAYRAATTAEVRRLADELGAKPVDAADLLAHLRGMHSDSDAYRAARTVIELGWRKTVGTA